MEQNEVFKNCIYLLIVSKIKCRDELKKGIRIKLIVN